MDRKNNSPIILSVGKQATGSTTANDIDGQSRPYNGVFDIGADEYWPFPLFAMAGDGSLRLDWATGASVLAGGVNHYETAIPVMRMSLRGTKQSPCKTGRLLREERPRNDKTGITDYEIVVTCAAGANPPNQGNCGQPINVGTATTFTLTGLSNFKQYTLVVNAYDSLANLISTSTTVTVFPTNLLVYLPLVLR